MIPSNPGVDPDATAEADLQRLRIATYNIHKGVSGFAWRNRIHDLRLGVNKLNADIMFLQEVQGRNDRHAQRFGNWPEQAQHEFLASDRWAEAVYGRNASSGKGAFVSDHGNAVLSRFPLLSHENLDISDHRFEQRGMLHCEIAWGRERLHCICAHLGLFEGSRQRQVDALIARIGEHVPDNEPLIIAGDFNDWRVQLGQKLREKLGVQEVFDQEGKELRRSPLHREITRRWKKGLQLVSELELRGEPDRASKSAAQSASSASAATDRTGEDMQPARTFPSAFPILRLDRVYVRGFKVEKATVMHGAAWRKLSDHAPIVVDLTISALANSVRTSA